MELCLHFPVRLYDLVLHHEQGRYIYPNAYLSNGTLRLSESLTK